MVENLKQSQEEVSLQPQRSQTCCSEDERCGQAAPMVGKEEELEPCGRPGKAGFAEPGSWSQTCCWFCFCLSLGGDSTLFLYPQPEGQPGAASRLNLPHVG